MKNHRTPGKIENVSLGCSESHHRQGLSLGAPGQNHRHYRLLGCSRSHCCAGVLTTAQAPSTGDFTLDGKSAQVFHERICPHGRRTMPPGNYRSRTVLPRPCLPTRPRSAALIAPKMTRRLWLSGAVMPCPLQNAGFRLSGEANASASGL